MNTSPRSSLLPLVRKFFEHDPLAAAHSLETMPESEAVAVLTALPPTLSAQAIAHLQVNHAASLLKNIPPEIFKEIMEKLETQHAAALFINLPKDLRERFVENLSEKLKAQIHERLLYPENSAGRLMSRVFLAFHSDIRVKDAISKIRALVKKQFPMTYTYVVDAQDCLVGVINMRDLMLADGDAPLERVMLRNVFSIHCMMDREEVASELSKRTYFAAPVVDAQNHLLGVVKADELLEYVQEEATEDLQKMFGAGGDERAFSPVSFSLKKRLPWLHINLVTAFLAAGVVSLFQDVIAKVTVLAVFMPVVAGQGGNAGAQSLAVVMRGLIMREIPKEKFRTLVLKETSVGALNGLVVGSVTAAIAWFWNGNPYLGLVIGLAMLCNLIAAGLFGAAIPLVMKAAGQDPAQSSNIILTTVTDVVGFFTFLGFGMLFQNYLI